MIAIKQLDRCFIFLHDSSCRFSADRVWETLEMQSMLFSEALQTILICAGKIRCAFHLSAYKLSAQIICSMTIPRNLRKVFHTVACCPYFGRKCIIIFIFMSFYIHFLEPAESPSYVQIQKLTALSASVTWEPLSKSSLKGKLMKYVVSLKESDKSILKSFDATEEKIDFMDLRPFTKYLVQVAACNSAGCGPKSEEIPFTTAEIGITMMVLTIFFYVCCN